MSKGVRRHAFPLFFSEINEKGTEAAAATGVVVVMRTKMPSPKLFLADRPFIFAIRHGPTNAILFMGRISDPTLEE